MKKILALFGPGELRASYADAGDFLRVLCVGFVGWFHIWQQSWLNPDLRILNHRIRFYPLVSSGYMFVDLMLLLSGFLLMLGWLSGRSRDLRKFYTARAARILPSYLLCIAIMLFAWALPRHLYGTSQHLWTDICAHLTFTHNFFPLSYSYTNLNGALWTLAVEVQFYLIFPLLARAFEKKPVFTYLGMVAVGFISRTAIALYVTDATIYVNRLSAMMDVYANGMLAAWIFVKLKNTEPKLWRAWLSTALTVLSAVVIYRILDAQLHRYSGESVHMGQLTRRFPLSIAGSVFLVCGSRSIRILRLLFSNRFIRFLSGISFNFYIWHQFLAVRLKALRIPYYEGENPNQAGLMPWQWHYTLCCFAAALLTSLLITYLVEKPCAKLIKRLLSRKDTCNQPAPVIK